MTAIFERINTGSTKLSAQEVRNAIYTGDIIKQIRLDSSSPLFVELLQNDKAKYMQRCRNEEFYIRLLAYNQVYQQLIRSSEYFVDNDKDSKISSSKDLMLCNYLYYCNNGLINYQKEKESLLNILNIILQFSKNAFCTVKRDSDEISDRIHEVFSEALVIALLNGSEIKITQKVFDDYKIKLWRDQETYIAFFHSTTELNHIKDRVNFMKKILVGEL